MSAQKTLGLVLVFVGLVVGLLMTLWLANNLTAGAMRVDGLLLGLALLALLVAPFLAAGVVLLVRGQAEDRERARVARQRRLLDMVLTRGQLAIAEAAVELDVSRDQIQAYIYDLVGKRLFTGYVNWKEGILYVREAAAMQSTECPNCGGRREVVGRGVVQCPHCGSELFL